MTKTVFDSIKGKKKFIFREELFGDIFIEDSMMIRNESISVGFNVTFPERESLSEQQMIGIEASLIKIFSRLPDNTTVHFQGQYFSSKESLHALKESVPSFLVKKYYNHLMDRPKMDFRCLLYITFNFGEFREKNPASTLLASLGIKRSKVISDIKQYKEKVKGLVQSFMVSMKGIESITLTQLTTNNFKRERKRYFNLDFDNPDPLTYENEIHNVGHSAVVGNKVATTIHMKTPGQNLYYTSPNDRHVHTFMPWPLGYALSFPHVINLTFTLRENQVLLEKLDQVKRTSSALGTMQRAEDRIIADDIEVFTTQMRQANERLCMVSHNVMLWDTNPDRLSYNLEQTRAAYLKMNGSHAVVDPFNAMNYFLTHSPGLASDSFDTMIMSVEDAILHFDYASPVIGDQHGIVLCNREREPVLVDLWHPSLVNKNIIAIGPSGSGKSFTFNFFITQFISQGNEIVILDVGGSYRNLFDINPFGVYKDYGVNSKFEFNPFLIPQNERGEYLLTQDKVVFLLSLINILWKDPKDPANNRLTKEEESVLSSFLNQYFTAINNKVLLEKPRLDRFTAFVQHEIQATIKAPGSNPELERDLKFFAYESFFLVIKKFISGPYSGALNSDENENIAINRLICFDLNGVKSDPILYPIVALIVIELILDKIRENPKIRKQIIIDEAWTMLQGVLSSFIEELFRTVRKAGGSVCIITQSIVELTTSPIGEALKANAAIKILLDHNSQPALIPDVKRFFGLTDMQTELLTSIRNGGTWREVFIMRNDMAQVFAIDVGEHNAAAFSSTAEDRADIKQLSKMAGPEYAINQFVENKNR